MKKIFGFLGAAALVAFASCSNDVLDGPEAPQQPTGEKGDLFLSLTIRPEASTRTVTENQGVEIGKDRENKISAATLLIADPNSNKVIARSQSTVDIVAGANETYVGTFGVDRNQLLTAIGDEASKNYDIYVIANPGALDGQYTVGSDLNQYIQLPDDDATYWTDNSFLMSNADKHTKTINKDDIKAGTHITPTDAYKLGTVEVQRAMSRFDIDTNNLTFTVGDATNGATVTFDAVALVNQATQQYLFKVTSDENTPLTQAVYNSFNATSLLFNEEKMIDQGDFNFVISPVQTAFTLPLYDGGVTNGKLTGNQKAFKTFSYDPFAGGTQFKEDDNAYDIDGANHPVTEQTYKIWRYCMENTIFDKNNQYHGNTTGVIFRAILSGSKFQGTDPVYAYGNVVFGKLADLVTYATSPQSPDDQTGVYSRVTGYYADALAKAQAAWNADGSNASNQWEEETQWQQNPEMVAAFNQILVKTEKFTIYRPENGKFYCYYTYWNRHNDNGNNTIMGDMEFATVRNNVYKLSVSSVVRLGHPGTPDDDPDPEDPGTPDESDQFYCTIDCKVLPWEVRINKIEF